MRAYFKSGRSLRITQQVANAITKMITEDDKHNIVIEKLKISNNVTLMINTEEVESIK